MQVRATDANLINHKDLCEKQKAFKNDKQSAEDSKIYKIRAN